MDGQHEQHPVNGGRVLSEWRLQTLEDGVKQILAIQGDILHRLDTLPCNERNTRLNLVERDVEQLNGERRAWGAWSAVNSLAIVLAGYFGIQIK